MRDYIIRRLVLIIPTILLITIVVFLLMRLIPGSVIDDMAAQMSSQGSGTVDRAMLEKLLGLDAPLPVQYFRWIGNALHGDLGESLRSFTPVTDKIVARLPVTFELGFMAILIGLLISVPVGILSAIRQDSIGDYVARSIAVVFISVPSFWIGTMIMLYPSLWWGWSPPMELIQFTKDPLGNLGMFIIPATVLGMTISGTTMRMMRTMLLEVLRQDYIRTAWSKGLSERVVVSRHAMKNALIPVITIIGYQIPLLVGGSVIIEQIFQLPGVGQLAVSALSQRDYPMVSGINLIVGTAVLFVNLAVDITYAYLDPRLHYQ